MRTIRSICLTALVLIGLCGVAAYFATSGLHDKHASDSALFTIAWLFSGLGVTTAACLIGRCLYDVAFGTRRFINNLFETYFRAAAITVVASCVIAFFSSWYDDGNKVDWYRALAFVIATIAGLVVGFLGILLVNGRESWIGEREARSSVRLRKVS